VGSYVFIKPIVSVESNKAKQESTEKPILYGLLKIPSIKLYLAKEILKTIEQSSDSFDNVIITGSFFNEGFNFNDIDLLVLSEKEQKKEKLRIVLEERFGVIFHIVQLTKAELMEGLASDPLYENMLSRCIAKKRIIFNVKRNINPKLLDFHLLKSKALIDNFDLLSGREKYYLIKNMVAILLFIEGKKISNQLINESIKKLFYIEQSRIEANLIEKKEFLAKYKKIYQKVFNLIMDSFKKENDYNGSKQK
jgi:predicted nucleotidyltransferase